MKIIKYEVLETVDSISNALEGFARYKCYSPYQNIEYFKISFKKYLFYSFIRLNRPYFIKFNINGKDVLLLPLSKSLLSSKFTIYGDRAGFGYLDFIYSENIELLDLEECFNILKNEYHEFVFIFNRIKYNSLSYVLLNRIAVLRGREKCVRVILNENFDGYFNKLSKSVRQNFRTANNRIIKSKKILELKHYKAENISRNVKNDIMRLYLKRLKFYQGIVSVFDKLFYKFIDIGFFAIDKIKSTDVFVIYIDGEMAAFMICMLNGDELSVPRLAINNKFSFYSPGILLTISAIKNISKCNNNIRYIDFMHGEEEYKFQLGGVIHECYSFEFGFNNGF